MIKVGATISLVPQLKGGPFLYWDGIADGCQKAAAVGFDAVEILPSSPDAFDSALLRQLLKEHGLHLTGMGTGAGFLLHKLHLCSPD